MERNYRIVAICDPYNARWHYHGERVLRYNMATPIEWIMEDELTEEEAHALLYDYASEGSCVFPMDDETLADWRKELLADGITEEAVDAALAWYQGPGYYNDDHALIYQYGDDYLRDDVMLYRIEMYNPNN